MKARICVLCVACGAIGSMLSGALQFRASAEDREEQTGRSKWQYTIEYAPSENRLNELGRQGWELVSAASKGPGDLNATCYLKRSAGFWNRTERSAQ